MKDVGDADYLFMMVYVELVVILCLKFSGLAMEVQYEYPVNTSKIELECSEFVFTTACRIKNSTLGLGSGTDPKKKVIKWAFSKVCSRLLLSESVLQFLDH